MTEIKSEVNEVFREVFDDQNITITEQMTAADVDGWDSVNHITLICAIEDKFSVRFSPREVAALNSVGDLLTLIQQKKQ